MGDDTYCQVHLSASQFFITSQIFYLKMGISIYISLFNMMLRVLGEIIVPKILISNPDDSNIMKIIIKTISK